MRVDSKQRQKNGASKLSGEISGQQTFIELCAKDVFAQILGLTDDRKFLAPNAR